MKNVLAGVCLLFYLLHTVIARPYLIDPASMDLRLPAQEQLQSIVFHRRGQFNGHQLQKENSQKHAEEVRKQIFSRKFWRR